MRELLCDENGKPGLKMQAYSNIKQRILKAICKPAESPSKVKSQAKTIVKRAISCITNLFEDVICFLSQVEVVSYEKESHLL